MENPDIDRPAVHIGFPFFAALFVASFFGAPFAAVSAVLLFAAVFLLCFHVFLDGRHIYTLKGCAFRQFNHLGSLARRDFLRQSLAFGTCLLYTSPSPRD